MPDSSPERVGPLRGEDQSAERITFNETAARRVNEAIEDGRVTRDGLTGFVCECGHLGCNAIVELSLGEYEAVRSGGRQFLLVPGHEAEFDTLVSQTPRYAIAAKQGWPGTIAELTDPRAEGD